MKQIKNPPQKSKALPDVIDSFAYAKLSDEEKKNFRPTDTKYDRLPRFCFWFYGLSLFCLGLYIAFMLNADFADFFNTHISSAGRWILATLTAWLPFSLGEFIIFMIPIGLVALLLYAFKYRCDTWRSALTLTGTVFSLIAALFSVFTLNFAPGYRGRSLDQKLALVKVPVHAQDLYETAEYLKNCVNAEAETLHFGQDGFSLMPYSLDTMRDRLDTSYDDFCQNHDFISHSPGQVKPVLLSEAMSYLHITGVYTFFTGEANLNVNFPDYTIPFTAAHEMAHQRGIAREDEANFIAYLVCISSDDTYIRYSGYLNMYEYVVSALASADRDLFAKSYSDITHRVKAELTAYGKFYEKYRYSTAGKISGVVNDSFLQSQGTPGTQSYGMVVDLAVAYHKETIPAEQ